MAEHRSVQDVGPRDHALELTGVVDHAERRDALLREHRVRGNEAFADTNRLDGASHVLDHGHFEIGHLIYLLL